MHCGIYRTWGHRGWRDWSGVSGSIIVPSRRCGTCQFSWSLTHFTVRDGILTNLGEWIAGCVSHGKDKESSHRYHDIQPNSLTALTASCWCQKKKHHASANNHLGDKQIRVGPSKKRRMTIFLARSLQYNQYCPIHIIMSTFVRIQHSSTKCIILLYSTGKYTMRLYGWG
jgi:hypothetical protein